MTDETTPGKIPQTEAREIVEKRLGNSDLDEAMTVGLINDIADALRQVEDRAYNWGIEDAFGQAEHRAYQRGVEEISGERDLLYEALIECKARVHRELNGMNVEQARLHAQNDVQCGLLNYRNSEPQT